MDPEGAVRAAAQAYLDGGPADPRAVALRVTETGELARDRPPTDGSWKGSTGFIDQPMISERLPAPGADTLMLMCGPPPMIKFACKANLDALGYAKERQLAF